MTDITVGYWNIRGLAEPIRYLLHYKNIKFTDKRYVFTDGAWDQDKFNLGLDFPNLPYMFDGKVKLTQSTTILRHLAKKFGLDGNTEAEKLRVSLAEQQLIDIRTNFFRSIYEPEFEENKPEYLKNASEHMKLFSNFLGERKFLVGDYVTYVDFMAYDVFDFHVLMSKNILDGFPNLKSYQERVKNLPGIKDYIYSSKYVAFPIASPRATWGGNGELPK